MKYSVPKGVHTIYDHGKRYPVVDGVVDIPGERVEWLQPLTEEQDLSKASVKELKRICVNRGIEVPEKATKNEIIQLIEEE